MSDNGTSAAPLTGGDNGILGVWPDKWAAGPASFYWLSIGVAAYAKVSTSTRSVVAV